MSDANAVDLVTGAFSYSGSHIAELLLDSGRGVRTLTFHPDRSHALQAKVQALPYRFDDPSALARSLEGVSTLYNTYWVRFDHGHTSFANAIENSRMLFHAADLARICVDAGSRETDTVVDAAGPETMPFLDLVALVRSTVEARSPIVHIPPPLMAVTARALGLLVRDVVLTTDEIKGLMTGLLVSHDPPLGRIAFSRWVQEHATSVGRTYANELDRHFTAELAA